MCRGCANRERIMRRTYHSIEAAVGALADAYAQGCANAHLRDGGLARFRAIVVDSAVFKVEPRKPAPTPSKKTTATHRRAVAAPQQLALAL